jgi:hypothetical protein
MTTLTPSLTQSKDEYIDRSDEAEYARSLGTQGVTFNVGDTIFTEQDHASSFTTEIGLDALTELAENLDG